MTANALTTKTATLSAPMLKKIARELMNDFRDGTDLVLDAVLAQLEAAMPEDEFVTFCGELEAA